MRDLPQCAQFFHLRNSWGLRKRLHPFSAYTDSLVSIPQTRADFPCRHTPAVPLFGWQFFGQYVPVRCAGHGTNPPPCAWRAVDGHVQSKSRPKAHKTRYCKIFYKSFHTVQYLKTKNHTAFLLHYIPRSMQMHFPAMRFSPCAMPLLRAPRPFHIRRQCCPLPHGTQAHG